MIDFSVLQDENHQILIENKQIQSKYLKSNEDLVQLRQEILKVRFFTFFFNNFLNKVFFLNFDILNKS